MFSNLRNTIVLHQTFYFLDFATAKVTGHFDTKLFKYKWYKWLRYELKQWNCTKTLITSSIVCVWTQETFWVNILHSLSHISWATYVKLFTTQLNKLASKRLCIETTGNHYYSTGICCSNFYSKFVEKFIQIKHLHRTINLMLWV